MSYNSYKLAELISTRISHDLAGGIGSLDNLIDCLEEGEPLEAEDKKILDKTAKDLRARQKFLRVAFGIGAKEFSTQEFNGLCQDYIITTGSQSRNISLTIKNIMPDLAKYMCLCVLIAVEITIKDANIIIDVNKNNISIKIDSTAQLAIAKIEAYKQILNNEILDDRDALQLIQLIYLREILGNDVPISLNTKEQNFAEIIIG